MNVDFNVTVKVKENVRESGILTLLQEAKPAWDTSNVDIKVRNEKCKLQLV